MTILFLGIVSAECTDSDGGKNKYEPGTVTDREDNFQDQCDNENVQEYFCSVEGIASYTTLPCVNGCLDDACQLANELPKSSAPEETDNRTFKLYFYVAIILVILSLYIYWFKLKKKKKGY